MAKTSYANTQLLFKPETVYGVEAATAGAGYSRLNAIRGGFQNTMEVDTFTAAGQTAPSIFTLNDEFAEGDIEGKADYNSIMHLLASMFGAPVSTETAASSGAWEHVFTYDGITPLLPQSYTVSMGQAGAAGADTILGFIFNSLGFSGGRGGLDLSSDGWGKAMTIGNTLGTVDAAKDIDPIPVSPLHGSIFLDSAAAGLGTTRLLDIYTMDVAFGERSARARPINALLTSDGVIEAADQAHTVQLGFMVDAVERARYAKPRNGTKEFVRVSYSPPSGGLIGSSGEPYLLQFDFCLGWTESGSDSDEDNVRVRPWTGTISRDVTWEMAAQILVRNSLASV